MTFVAETVQTPPEIAMKVTSKLMPMMVISMKNSVVKVQNETSVS